jgi:uncharacterized protein YacL
MLELMSDNNDAGGAKASPRAVFVAPRIKRFCSNQTMLAAVNPHGWTLRFGCPRSHEHLMISVQKGGETIVANNSVPIDITKRLQTPREGVKQNHTFDQKEAGVNVHGKKVIFIARVFFVLIATSIGAWIGLDLQRVLLYSLIGFFASLFIILIEYATDFVSSKKILLAGMGLFVGLAMSALVYPTIPRSVMDETKARIVCNLLLGYLGILLALKHEERLSLSRLKFIIANPSVENASILDTNVIIDGRVADIYGLNFLSGPLIVPEFVLKELQLIADSTDPKKRSKGRRGLEHLEGLKEMNPQIQVYEKDYPDIKDVDTKLIQLAKEINGRIITNDYNLNKVASIHRVTVLNINELALALKPPVSIGDEICVSIIREGKDAHQGVGYLEDGTMVVVDNGSGSIGRDVDIVVTSILQSETGRMIFGRLRDAARVRRVHP